MTKYRRLGDEEFGLLEGEFIRFLASNSIQAEDWNKLKSDSPDKVLELLDVFSDTVLEKVYAKVEYLIIIKPTELLAFKMDETFAKLIGVRFNNSNLNLSEEHELEMVFSSDKLFFSHQPDIFSLEKKYDKSKPKEVFFLLNQGADVADSKWFDLLVSLKTKA